MGVFLRVLLVVGAVLLVIKLLKSRRKPPEPPPPAPAARPAVKPPAEIVACAHCALRLPQAEAVQAGDGRYFCGEAHRRAAEQRLD